MIGKRQTDKIRSLPVKILRTSLFAFFGLFLIVALLLTGLYFANKTELFKRKVAEFVSKTADKNLEGELRFSKIDINLFKGVRVYETYLFARNDTVFYSPEISVFLNVKALMKNKISVRAAAIESPRIKLLRSKDSTWNFEHIAKPSEDTTKTTSKSKWKIFVNKFRIKDGKIRVYDSTDSQKYPGLNYSNLYLEDFSLRLQAGANLSDDDYKVKISELKFVEANSGFELKKFFAASKADKNGAELSRLEIKTSESKINLKAAVNRIDLFSTENESNFDDAELSLKFDGKNLSGEEIRFLANLDQELVGSASLKIEASGKPSRIKIDKFDFDYADTKLELSGEILDANDPEQMSYSANIKLDEAYLKDIKTAMPDLDLSEAPEVTSIQGIIYAQGSPNDISADFDLETNAGGLRGKADYNMKAAGFFADVTARGANLAQILRNPELSSNLNGRVVAEGSGSGIEDLTLVARVNMSESSLSDYSISKLELIANVNSGILNLDTLHVELPKENTEQDEFDFGYSTSPYLASRGIIDLTNPGKPSYDVSINLNALNAVELVGDSSLPQYFSASVAIYGSGAHPDSLEGIVELSLLEAYLSDRAILPFSAKAELSRHDGNFRKLTVNSEFIDLNLEGNFLITKISKLFADQGLYLAKYVNHKIASIGPEEFATLAEPGDPKKYKIGSFAPANLTLEAKISNISSIAALFGDVNVDFEADARATLDVTETQSSLKIDSLKIVSFDYESEKTDFHAQPSAFYAELEMSVEDSVVDVSNLLLSADCGDLRFGGNKLNEPYFRINFANDLADYEFGGGYNDFVSASQYGKIEIGDTTAIATLDETEISLSEDYKWFSPWDAEIVYSGKTVELRQFSLKRKEAEYLTLRGKLIEEEIDDLNLRIFNIDLGAAKGFLDEDTRELTESLNGNLDEISVGVRGNVESPVIEARLNSSDISYGGVELGKLIADLKLEDQIASGSAALILDRNGSQKAALEAVIESLPLNFDAEEAETPTKPEQLVKASISLRDLPLELADAFAVGIDNLRGRLGAEIRLGGNLPDKLTFDGDVTVKDTYFKLEATNLEYGLSGGLNFDNDKISLEQVKLRNNPADIKNGVLNLSGNIYMKDFNPENFDVSAESDRFLALNEAARATDLGIYGRLIVSTGARPINLSGSLATPIISGDLNVLQADLTLPQSTAQTAIKSSMRYVVSGSRVKFFQVDSVADSPPVPKENTSDVAEAFGLNLRVYLKERANMNIELGFLGELHAEMETKEFGDPLYVNMSPGEALPQVTGNSLKVLPGSRLNYTKIFETTGEISFPTGEIDNPALDLKAVYGRDSEYEGRRRNFKVILFITGTKDKPNVRFTYTIDGQEPAGDSTDVAQDAIFLLLFGKTKSELTSGGGGGGSLTSQTMESGADAVATKILTDLLQGSGFVQSAEVNLAGGNFDESTIVVTGKIFGDFRWKVGGTVADLSNNNEITIEYPLPWVIHQDYLNNMVFQLTKASNISTVTTPDQKDWEVRIKLGGSW